jgi:hypothetical protein
MEISGKEECTVCNNENFVAPNVSEVLIIGDETIADKSALQNSFLRFRDQKIKEKNLMKACRDASFKGGRTVEYKENLRNKFLETAKRYLGVPYGVKYKKEEDPVAPLYLDCCGLVRQCVQDLQEDFGFVIGKWNQAYQMDTLPVVLTEAELKPGDLIFYEGTYISERSKKQKHNNVHVEIYLGGETGRSVVECLTIFRNLYQFGCFFIAHCRRGDNWLSLSQGKCFHFSIVQIYQHDVDVG